MMSADDTPPLISVIAVSYNHERWVLETLESIKQQTLQDFELIFCDDASQDRSVQIATQWLEQQTFRSRTILHQQNRGVCRTLNEALAMARGKYVQLIACDDLMLPDKLENHTKLFANSSPDVGVVYSRARLIGPNGSPIAPYTFENLYGFPFPMPEPQFDTLLRGNQIAAMSTLIRRDVLQAVGNYDETLTFEDWDMWLRISRAYRFAADSNYSVKYRIHGNNLHLKLTETNPTSYWIWKKHLDVPAARDCLARWIARCIELGSLPDAIREDYLQWVKSDPQIAQEQLQSFLAIVAHAADEHCRVKSTWDFRIGRALLSPIRAVTDFLLLRFPSIPRRRK